MKISPLFFLRKKKKVIKSVSVGRGLMYPTLLDYYIYYNLLKNKTKTKEANCLLSFKRKILIFFK